MNEKIIVTAALPYANGDIHIGHLLEYIQTDIFVRFLKLTGKDALYICASDMHGTPVEVNAAKAKKKPEQFALAYWKEHQKDFKSFLIHFDNYYKTHSSENKELSEYFFSELKRKGHIYTKNIYTIYCPHCQRSLPDRYVKGTCPRCTTMEQYGDICESCSTALKGIDLINPQCTLCGRTPIQKESIHYFFKLSMFSRQLQEWMFSSSSQVQPEVRNWLKEWLSTGLEDWCISRDGPYFGFEIPNSKKETGQKKYFYVWLDAPIGYISSTKNYCDKHTLRWEDYWKQGRVHHIIGKDISYFHFLFWPAMLIAMGIPLPTLTVHGFITVNGQKMSKSRGTLFTAKDFLKLYPAESLRFFYASHLDRKVIDIDLNFEEFRALTNNVLMGSLGNFCYRVLTFAHTNYGSIHDIANERPLQTEIEGLISRIHASYQAEDFKTAVKHILQVADIGNSYFQRSEVWKDTDSTKSRKKVGWCVALARNLAILVSPILPLFSVKVLNAVGTENVRWDDLTFTWKGTVKKPALLVQKIENLPRLETFPLHLAVGKVLAVKNHPSADTLYLFTVDFGKQLGKRQVVAGVRPLLPLQAFLNRKLLFCINLKPATFRGEKSEAMILVADDKENIAPLYMDKSGIGDPVCPSGMSPAAGIITIEEFRKINLYIHQQHVFYENKPLSSHAEDVLAVGVREGSRVV